MHITAINWGTQRQYLKNTSVKKKIDHLKHNVAAAEDFNTLGRGGKTGSHILPVSGIILAQNIVRENVSFSQN